MSINYGIKGFGLNFWNLDSIYDPIELRKVSLKDLTAIAIAILPSTRHSFEYAKGYLSEIGSIEHKKPLGTLAFMKGFMNECKITCYVWYSYLFKPEVRHSMRKLLGSDDFIKLITDIKLDSHTMSKFGTSWKANLKSLISILYFINSCKLIDELNLSFNDVFLKDMLNGKSLIYIFHRLHELYEGKKRVTAGNIL